MFTEKRKNSSRKWSGSTYGSPQRRDLGKEESFGEGQTRNAYEIEGGKSYRTMGRWNAAIVMITNQVGLGILSLPGAAQDIGVVPTVILIIAVGSLSTYTAYELLQYYRRHPHVLNMADQAEVLGGKTLQIITGIGMVIKLILTCASAGVTMSVALNSMSEHAMCTVAFIAFSIIGCWLLCLPRTFQFVSWVGIPSTVSIIAGLLITIISLGVKGPQGTPQEYNLQVKAFADNVDFNKGVGAFLRVTYSYAGNVGFPSLMAEMENPSQDFVPALVILQSFSITFYLVSAIAIYCLAGQFTSSPALGSAPETLAKVAYGIVFPALLATGLVFGHTSIKLMYITGMRVIKAQDQITSRCLKSWVMWIGMVTSFWVLAFILANAIPIFDSIVSISSATFIAWFTFGLAAILWFHMNWGGLFLNWRKATLSVLNFLIICMALFMNVGGLYAAISGLLDIYENDGNGIRGSFTCANNAIF